MMKTQSPGEAVQLVELRQLWYFSSKELQARTFLTEAEKFQQVTDSMTQSMHEKTSDLIDKYPP